MPAGYSGKVQVSADDISYSDLPLNSPSLNDALNMLDLTDLSNSSAGNKTRGYGLRDWSISGEGNYTGANAAISILRTAFNNRTAVYVKFLPDGSTGKKGQVLVENINISLPVDDKTTFSVSLQGTGAVTDIS